MGRGAPSKIHDAELRKALLKAVEAGMSYKDASAFAGLSERSFHNWKKRAETAIADISEGGSRAGRKPLKKDLPYIELFKELNQAKQQAQYGIARAQFKLARGGGKVRETVRSETFLPGENGQLNLVKVEERTHVKTLAPDGSAGRYILDRRFGWAEADGAQEVADSVGGIEAFRAKAEERRKQAAEALAMFDGLEEPDPDA
jgi:transposase